MKKFLFFLAAAAAIPGLGAAQSSAVPAQASTKSQVSPEVQVARRTQFLTKELGLTGEQQTKLQAILLAQRQEMAGFRGQRGAGRRQGVGPQLKATQAKYDQQVRAVLTADQYAKFDEFKDQQRDKLRERRAGGQARQTPE
ncbi:MAG TPA: hypothetical protein VF630_17160 [Hymenobacter sp.]|jgi:Spy/CpxP family protein refolding chaperone